MLLGTEKKLNIHVFMYIQLLFKQVFMNFA